MAGVLGKRRGRLAVLAPGFEIRTARDQRLDAVPASLLHGEHQRRHAVGIRRIGVSALRERVVDRSQVALLRCEKQ